MRVLSRLWNGIIWPSSAQLSFPPGPRILWTMAGILQLAWLWPGAAASGQSGCPSPALSCVSVQASTTTCPLGSGPRYMIYVTHFALKNLLTCKKCTLYLCNSCMSVGFYICSTCYKIWHLWPLPKARPTCPVCWTQNLTKAVSLCQLLFSTKNLFCCHWTYCHMK